MIVNACGSAVGNLLPGGGAAGVVVTYHQLRSWGFLRRDISTMVIVTGVWNVLARVVLPVVGIRLMIVFAGDLNPVDAAGRHGRRRRAHRPRRLRHLWVLASDRPATPSAAGCSGPCASGRGKKAADTDLEKTLVGMRHDIIEIVRYGWLEMTYGLVGFFGINYILFWFCHNTMGVQMPFAYMFVAYTVGRLLTAVGGHAEGRGRHRGRHRRRSRRVGRGPHPGDRRRRALLALHALPRGAPRGARLARLVVGSEGEPGSAPGRVVVDDQRDEDVAAEVVLSPSRVHAQQLPVHRHDHQPVVGQLGDEGRARRGPAPTRGSGRTAPPPGRRARCRRPGAPKPRAAPPPGPPPRRRRPARGSVRRRSPGRPRRPAGRGAPSSSRTRSPRRARAYRAGPAAPGASRAPSSAGCWSARTRSAERGRARRTAAGRAAGGWRGASLPWRPRRGRARRSPLEWLFASPSSEYAAVLGSPQPQRPRPGRPAPRRRAGSRRGRRCRRGALVGYDEVAGHSDPMTPARPRAAEGPPHLSALTPRGRLRSAAMSLRGRPSTRVIGRSADPTRSGKAKGSR